MVDRDDDYQNQRLDRLHDDMKRLAEGHRELERRVDGELAILPQRRAHMDAQIASIKAELHGVSVALASLQKTIENGLLLVKFSRWMFTIAGVIGGSFLGVMAFWTEIRAMFFK